MRKILDTIIGSGMLALLLMVGADHVSAQNMSGSVVKKEVKFARGKSQATLRGTAKYAMSYVFDLDARSGQTMEINLAGKNSQLTFSVIAPDEETIDGAFGVAKWSGELPQSGKYSIVVVMNDENARPVPFSLIIKIN